MRISLNGNELKLSLSYVLDIFHRSGTSIGSTLPILLTAKEGVLILSSFKDSVYIKHKLVCDAKEKVSVCVDALLIKKLPLPAKEITLFVKNSRMEITIPKQKIKYSVPVLEKISVSMPKIKNFFEIQTKALASAFKSISLIPRQIPELDVKLSILKNRMRLETVDFPYVGAVCTTKVKSKIKEDISVTIPSSFIKTLLKLNNQDTVKIHASPSNFSFVSDTTTIVQPGRQISLPDIEDSVNEALKEKPVLTASVNTKQFNEQLNLCTKFRGKNLQVLSFKMTFYKHKADIEVISDIEATGEVDVINGPKKPCTLVLSTEYVVDIVGLLSLTPADSIDITAWENKILFCAGNVKFIMPLMEDKD